MSTLPPSAGGTLILILCKDEAVGRADSVGPSFFLCRFGQVTQQLRWYLQCKPPTFSYRTQSALANCIFTMHQTAAHLNRQIQKRFNKCRKKNRQCTQRIFRGGQLGNATNSFQVPDICSSFMIFSNIFMFMAIFVSNSTQIAQFQKDLTWSNFDF